MRKVTGLLPALMAVLAQPAYAGLEQELKAIREAHESYERRLTASVAEMDGAAPAPPEWYAKETEQGCRVAWRSVEKFLGNATEAFDASRAWGASASAGFAGDSAGSTERSKANIEAEFKAGDYPDQFRLKVGASLDFDEQRTEELSEDVTSVLLNYDRYFTPKYEGFAFIERFTDSFMAIDQRYEVGFGLKREWNLWRRPEDGDVDRSKHSKNTQKRDALPEVANAARKAVDDNPKCVVDQKWQKIKIPEVIGSKASGDHLYQFLNRATKRLQLGISLAVLAEFEQADTLTFTTQLPAAEPVPQTFKEDGLRRYRLSIRPSGKVRVTDEVTFEFATFYKAALDSPRRGANGARDYRIDAFGELAWKFGSLKQGSDKPVSLVVRYDWRYDSVPPTAQEIIDALNVPPADILVVGRVNGEKRHSMAKMSLKVEF